MNKLPSKVALVSAALALFSFAAAYESGNGAVLTMGSLFLIIGIIDYCVGSPVKKAKPAFFKG